MDAFVKHITNGGLTAMFMLENGISGMISITNRGISQRGSDNAISQSVFRENDIIDSVTLKMYQKRMLDVGDVITKEVYAEFVEFGQQNFERMILGEDISKEIKIFFSKHRIVKVLPKETIEVADNKGQWGIGFN